METRRIINTMIERILKEIKTKYKDFLKEIKKLHARFKQSYYKKEIKMKCETD
jgi:hypothetical protein